MFTARLYDKQFTMKKNSWFEINFHFMSNLTLAIKPQTSLSHRFANLITEPNPCIICGNVSKCCGSFKPGGPAFQPSLSIPNSNVPVQSKAQDTHTHVGHKISPPPSKTNGVAGCCGSCKEGLLMWLGPTLKSPVWHKYDLGCFVRSDFIKILNKN